MKHSLAGLLVIGLALFAAGAASGVTVWLNPSYQLVDNSVTLTVDLLISDVASPGIDTFNLVLRFDQDLINATGASFNDVVFGGTTFADYFVDTDESYSTFGPELDNVNGEMSFTLWNVGSLGATGSGTVATLTFVSDASNKGKTTLDYTAWLLEPGTAKNITFDQQTADVVVVEETTVVPEPATLLLVAAGLAALGGYVKRRG